MVPMWLHDSSGNRVTCVYVPLPLPAAVTYGGATYYWNAHEQHYRQVSVPLPDPYAPVGLRAEVPESERPPHGAA